jgi:rod shape-determining protein MreC
MLMYSRYTWWVAGMIGLAVLLLAASQVGALNPIQSVFLTVATPFEKAISATFRPIANVLSDAGDINELQDENQRLRLENESLQNELASLRIQAERAAELEQALNVSRDVTDQTLLAANVVHRDASPFTDVVSIDRGTNDGVKTGMVVVSAQGTLMGTVTKALSDHAFVRLISDSKSRVAAEVLETRADGVVKGTANRTLVFDFAQADVKIGDVIVTSSLTGRFPAGIPIGKVTEVSGSPQDLFRTVGMEPLVRLGTARTVLVITSFAPQDVALEEDSE